MATIQDRPDRRKRYRVMYRDPDGRQRSQSFVRKAEATAFANTVEADKLRGAYVDPQAGKVTFRTFAEQWLAAQTFDVSTREAVTSRLKVHLYPTFGRMQLRTIKPSTVQGWLRGRQQECAPTYVKVLLANLSAILSAAVADGLIVANPCSSSSVKAPRVDRRRVVPWPRAQVQAVAAAHPDRYRAVPTTTAGCGLRQGETFGLAVEDVDFLRRTVHVRRQVKLVKGRSVFGPPKGGRERDVPLPDAVAVALSEHLRAFPAVEVTLPWGDHDGKPVTVALIFTSRERGPLDRNHYNPYVWKPALERAEVEPTRENGMHALRHYAASAWLEGGVSIRAVAEYLGHADPGFTLRTYAHLMPEAEDRARTAMDSALSGDVAQVLPEGAQDAE